MLHRIYIYIYIYVDIFFEKLKTHAVVIKLQNLNSHFLAMTQPNDFKKEICNENLFVFKSYSKRACDHVYLYEYFLTIFYKISKLSIRIEYKKLISFESTRDSFFASLYCQVTNINTIEAA